MTFTTTTHHQPFHFDPSLPVDVSGASWPGRPIADAVDARGAPPDQLRFGAFRFEVASERLFRGVREVPLKPKMRDMLLFFIRNPQRLIGKPELLAAIWGETHVSPETLRSSLRELRNVLGDDARTPQFVETVHGRGYRFLCDVIAERQGATRPALRPAPTLGDAADRVIATSAAPAAAAGPDRGACDPRLQEIAERLRDLAERPDAAELSAALAECAELLSKVASGGTNGSTLNGVR